MDIGQRVLRLFVLPGVLFGLFTGLQHSSVSRGVVAGSAFAVLFGGSMTVLIATRERRLSDVAPADRRTVARLVQQGAPVTDRQLAPAVLEYAAMVRRAQGQPQTTRRMATGFIALSVVVLVIAIASGHPTAIVADAVLLALWINNRYRLPKRRAAILSRVEHAEQAAQQLLADPHQLSP